MPLASFYINPRSILTFSTLLLYLYSISFGLGIQAVDLEHLLLLWTHPGLLLSLESKWFFYISPENQPLNVHWLPNLHFLIPSAIFILVFITPIIVWHVSCFCVLFFLSQSLKFHCYHCKDSVVHTALSSHLEEGSTYSMHLNIFHEWTNE